MASYFVARHAQPDGAHAVHDRSRCPPACFPFENANEYLGEFHEVTQALAVARLRYAQARDCTCWHAAGIVSLAAGRAEAFTLAFLRS